MATASVFHIAIEKVLNSWTALQLAVEHGCGGVDGQAKAVWMVDAVDQWFKENDDIEIDELEGLLADILDEEFDTVADDGSLNEVSRLICGYFRLCQQGKQSQVQEEISQLRKANTAESKLKHSQDDEMECDDAPSTSRRSLPHHPPEDKPPEQEKENGDEGSMDAEDDGWTTVSRTKRR